MFVDILLAFVENFTRTSSNAAKDAVSMSFRLASVHVTCHHIVQIGIFVQCIFCRVILCSSFSMIAYFLFFFHVAPTGLLLEMCHIMVAVLSTFICQKQTI